MEHHRGLLGNVSLLLLLAVVASCEDTNGTKTDLGSTKDSPMAGKDRTTGTDTGGADVGPDKTVVDSSSPDTGGPDAASADLPLLDRGRDSKPKADLGPCQQSGQPCGGTKGTCCAALKCCSGNPVPPGKEYCATTCPKSDRNVKYGFKKASSEMVLEQLAQLPITTWTYNNEPSAVRHIGPMAQDFKAVFGVGATDRFISPLDAAGVALISIQALNRQVKQLSHKMRALEQQNRALQQLLRSTHRPCRP